MTSLGRVLVVDDESTVLDMISLLLGRAGYQADCVTEVETAEQLAQKNSYDLLISDIKMPGNTDLQFVRNLTRSLPGLPVILMTGYPEVDSAMESLKLGVVAYVVKPFKVEELLLQVQASIQHGKVQKAVLDGRTRLNSWNEDLASLEEKLSPENNRQNSLPVDAFINLTFKNIAGSLSDLKRLAEAAATEDALREACGVLSCPRMVIAKRLLAETVEVLQNTKHLFKSKELAELRKKIENELEAWEKPPASPPKPL